MAVKNILILTDYAIVAMVYPLLLLLLNYKIAYFVIIHLFVVIMAVSIAFI